jgi:hypothetical protein
MGILTSAILRHLLSCSETFRFNDKINVMG